MTTPPSSISGIASGTSTVTLDDLEQKSFPPDSIDERVPFLQRTGRELFAWVLISTLGVLVVSFLYLFLQTWRLDSSILSADSTRLSGPDTVAIRLLVEQRAAAFERFLQIIKELVVAVFLPLMTAVLGYLFGTREGQAQLGAKEGES